MQLRLPGRSLSARLLLVLAIPLVGMILFATMWAWQRLDDSREAAATSNRTTAIVAGADLLFTVELSRTMVDLILNETNGVGTFKSFVELQTRAQAVEIATLLDRLRTLPASSADERKCLEAIIDAVDELRGVAITSGPDPRVLSSQRSLAALTRASTRIEAEVLKLRGQQATLETGLLLALSDLHRSTVRDGSMTLALAYSGDAPRPSRVHEEAAATRSAYRTILVVAPPNVQLSIRDWEEGVVGRRWRTFQDEVLAGRPVDLLSGVRTLMARTESLSNLKAQIGRDLIGTTAATARSARRGFVTALWLAAAILLGSLILAAVTLRPATRRLRQLERQARRISTGDLSVEPVGGRGRDETALLANSFDLMSGTLTTLQRQVDALADGRVDAEFLAESVPGRIGDSVTRSVARLTEMTSKLRLNEELARLSVDAAVEAIWIVDEHSRVVSANPAAVAISGAPTVSLTTRDLWTLLSLDAEPPAGASGTELTNAEGHVRRGDRDPVDVLVSTRRIAPTDGAVRWMIFARDISDRKRLEARLDWEATHDPLTTLPNRTALTRHLAAVDPSAGASLTALFIDLDGFKRINDALGHRIGDDVLCEVAGRLRGVVRAEDLVARLGGDEFVILLGERGSPPGDVDALAHRLLDELERPFVLHGLTAHLSASVGIATTAGETDPTELIRMADLAMYRSKVEGRGSVSRYDVSMHALVAERVEMEEALREAILGGRLTPFFQPVVGAVHGELTRIELLARWNRPGHGPVSPERFIPLAEEAGLVRDIGRWALRSAAATAVELRRRHPGFSAPIAVNISGMHVIRGDLVADLEAALLEAGAEPGWLSIELTESYLLDESIEYVDAALHRLVDLGVSLSIDDFGTGYSSMTYLRRLPAAVVKVDRSFVTASGGPTPDHGIVEMVATLAHTLGMRVVAEGVETREQAERVRAAGCDEIQGYLVARPMSSDDLVTWLDRLGAPLVWDELMSGASVGR